MSYPVPLTQAQADVVREQERQIQLKREGRFEFTPRDPVSNCIKLAMLMEEVGEVARDTLAYEGIVQETGDLQHLRKELVQVAAIATSWAEAIPAHVHTEVSR